MKPSDRPSSRVEHDQVLPLLENQLVEIKRADSSAASAASLPMRRVSRRLLGRVRNELSDRDQAILADVVRCRLMTGAQLQQLHFALSGHATFESAARACRRVLRRLVDKRVLHALQRRIGGVRAGSQGLTYEIGSVGRRLLGEAHPSGRREPGYLFVDHTLAIADWYVRLVLAQRDGRCDQLFIEVEAEAWRSFVGVSGRQLLAPDLFVRLAVGDDELGWFIEVDRGTEHQASLRRKAERYIAYYQTGIESERLGFFPRVLWIVEDNKRVADVARALRNVRRLVRGLLAVTTTDGALPLLLGQIEPTVVTETADA